MCRFAFSGSAGSVATGLARTVVLRSVKRARRRGWVRMVSFVGVWVVGFEARD